jgi:hypothetical protein
LREVILKGPLCFESRWVLANVCSEADGAGSQDDLGSKEPPVRKLMKLAGSPKRKWVRGEVGSEAEGAGHKADSDSKSLRIVSG